MLVCPQDNLDLHSRLQQKNSSLDSTSEKIPPIFQVRSHLLFTQHSHISHLLQILLSNIGGANEAWSSYPMGIFHFSRHGLAFSEKSTKA